MVLDGVNWRESIARHKAAPQEALIRKTLAQYQALGYTYLRDGGDRWGAGALAAKLAPEYGIRYRTPWLPHLQDRPLRQLHRPWLFHTGGIPRARARGQSRAARTSLRS